MLSVNRSRNDAFVRDVPSFYNKEHGPGTLAVEMTSPSGTPADVQQVLSNDAEIYVCNRGQSFIFW